MASMLRLFCLFTVLMSCLACPKFWTEFQSNCYLYIGNPSLNWQEAENFCVDKDAHLASIHSREEDDFVKEIWRRSRDAFTMFPRQMRTQLQQSSLAPFVYIGLNDMKENGKFEWTDRTPVDYVNWMRNNPSTDIEIIGEFENAVFIWDRKNIGQWNDVSSKSPVLRGSFVCKKPL
ncbi:Echinoidin [Holothuria leucospilota]|uniref:Echinoidin n=1 Tax=Holothuria leucospilota TaxID=206669 RepID=A0A9Q1BM65_HOLLE|nr:Echinoidin [Holothuria leucospilota]